jgi:hypothetical protein
MRATVPRLQRRLKACGDGSITRCRSSSHPVPDKGIATELLGPGVVIFGPKGVTVEALPWLWGKAIFEASLDDDWHLVKPTRHPPLLVRFRRR